MTLTVHGVHCELGDALKAHVTEKLQTLDEKYFGRGVNASVTFSKTEHKGFRANIITHVGSRTYQADAIARDAHKALDAAASKLSKQLRRDKSRVRDGHGAKMKARLDELLDARSVTA